MVQQIEAGDEAVKTGGVWAVVPRKDTADVSAFNKFTEDVIKEQELLFPPAPKNVPGGGGGFF